MDETTGEGVSRLATRFRQACESGVVDHVAFAKFPRGSCGIASRLLAYYLANAGLGLWALCGGWAGQEDTQYSHAWLEHDGWILDVTADQFDVTHPSVWLTRDRTWHSRFTSLTRWVVPACRPAEMDDDIRQMYHQLAL